MYGSFVGFVFYCFIYKTVIDNSAVLPALYYFFIAFTEGNIINYLLFFLLAVLRITKVPDVKYSPQLFLQWTLNLPLTNRGSVNHLLSRFAMVLVTIPQFFQTCWIIHHKNKLLLRWTSLLLWWQRVAQKISRFFSVPCTLLSARCWTLQFRLVALFVTVLNTAARRWWTVSASHGQRVGVAIDFQNWVTRSVLEKILQAKLPDSLRRLRLVSAVLTL